MFTLPPLVITPNLWPQMGFRPNFHHPGDLSRFLENGTETYYGAGYHERYRNPMLAAPSSEGDGGTVYFQNDINRETLGATMRAMGIVDRPGAPKQFVVYAAESQKPGEEGYLRQLRFISHFAMTYAFHAAKEKEESKLPTQPVYFEEAVWMFIEHERQHWGTSFTSPKLDGLFGGDGHFAREELSFGLSVESSYFQVFRLFSRAWLVHK